jgi:hypothetical protein
MSGDNMRQLRAPEEAPNANNGNESTEEGNENHARSESERAEPFSRALVELAMLVQQQQQQQHQQQQQQQQQQHLQALIQHARTMQHANMILQLDAQLQHQGRALPTSALALSLAAASNFNLPGQINLSATPEAHALPAALANPTPDAETSFQGAVAMLASAANLQQVMAQLQNQRNQNHHTNAARIGSVAAGAAALGINPPLFQTALSNSADYRLLGGIGLQNEVMQAAQYLSLGIPSSALAGLGLSSPFSILQQHTGGFPFGQSPTVQVDSSVSGSTTGSLSLINASTSAPSVTVAGMAGQLPAILSMLQRQQGAVAAPLPPSITPSQRAPDVPTPPSVSSSTMSTITGEMSTARAASPIPPSQSVGNLSRMSAFPSEPPGEAGAPSLTDRPPIALHLEEDSHSLNAYQCLLRKQIELFETAPTSGVEGRSQGRNTPIRIGQVGIRCRHCASLPNKARPKGAVYYSKSLDGVYQVSQNMSKVHLTERCRRIPNIIKQRLISLHSVNRRASGGKPYWVDGIRQLGVYEDGPILRFLPAIPRKQDNTSSDGKNEAEKLINR